MAEPLDEINALILNSLQAMAVAGGIPVKPEHVRMAFDISGDDRDLFGIAVSGSDNGNHNGIPWRVLVDVSEKVAVYTHLDEDTDGTIMENIISGILPILHALPDTTGWKISNVLNWTRSPATTDGVYRTTTLSATFNLQRK